MALDLEYLRQYKSQTSQPTGGPTLDLEYLKKKREEEEPSLAKIGAGFVTDIAISETARLGGQPLPPE
jgi:hypothetical protein